MNVNLFVAVWIAGWFIFFVINASTVRGLLDSVGVKEGTTVHHGVILCFDVGVL